MVALPTPPTRAYSFTDLTVLNPDAQPPGDRLDAEYDRSNAVIAQLIAFTAALFNTDGSLKPNSVSPAALTADLTDTLAALDTARLVLEDARSLQWAEYLAGPVVNSADAPAYIGGSPFPNGLYYQPVQGGSGGLYSAKWWAIQAAEAKAEAASLIADIPVLKFIPLKTWTGDDIATNYQLRQLDDTQAIPDRSSDLLVSVNGYFQEADVDYTVSGSTLTFVVPPAYGAPVWALWIAGRTLEISSNTITAGGFADALNPAYRHYQLMHSDTAGQVPANILPYELACNTADRKLFLGSAAGTPLDLFTGDRWTLRDLVNGTAAGTRFSLAHVLDGVAAGTRFSLANLVDGAVTGTHYTLGDVLDGTINQGRWSLNALLDGSAAGSHWTLGNVLDANIAGAAYTLLNTLNGTITAGNNWNLTGLLAGSAATVGGRWTLATLLSGAAAGTRFSLNNILDGAAAGTRFSLAGILDGTATGGRNSLATLMDGGTSARILQLNWSNGYITGGDGTGSTQGIIFTDTLTAFRTPNGVNTWVLYNDQAVLQTKLTVGGVIQGNSDVQVAGGLGVAGISQIHNLQVTGDAYVSGRMAVGGHLNVLGMGAYANDAAAAAAGYVVGDMYFSTATGALTFRQT